MSPNLEQRDELAMKMLAAWLGVPVDKVPGEWGVFNDPASMAAWKRVAQAAREHIANEGAQ